MIEENDDADDLKKINKEKFIKTQKIEFDKDVEAGEVQVKRSDNSKRRTSSLSKTLSKTSLLAKIKSAVGKHNLGQTQKISFVETSNKIRKSPKRFIVKKS